MFKSIDPGMLPDNMLMYVDIDVGENSNSNIIKKMTMVGQQLIPALQQSGAGGVVAPEAAAKIACKTLEAMDLDPLDFLVDYTDLKFVEQAMQARQAEQQAGDAARKLEEKIKELDAIQREATVELTRVQSRNAMQDNTKQLMVALDKSYQEWAKLSIQAAEKGVTLDPRPSAEELLAIAKQMIDADSVEEAPQQEMMEQQQPQQPMM